MTALSHLIPADTIFLSDHNSVILPTRDVSLPRSSPEQRDVLEAREQEISFLTRHGLIDAFATLHADRTDNFPLAGWTWGFPPAHPSGTPAPDTEHHKFDLSDTSIDRQRRIDRVMIPSAFMSYVCECFPCFLASSDHKAVVLSLRASTDSHQRRSRCPTSFLECDDTVNDIASQLQHIPTTGFAQWADSMTFIRHAALHMRKHIVIQVLLKSRF